MLWLTRHRALVASLVVEASVLVAVPGGAQAPDAEAAPVAEAPAAPATPASAVPALPFEKYTLGNGLEVILHQDKRAPQVTVNVWYHVGALHEERGRSGFAYLFEHLMFQGSAHVPSEQHIKLLEEAGATFVNGSTDFDRTDYYQTVPRHEFELALWLEADRMGWLMEPMTQAKLDEQRAVVKNERRQTTEGVPWGVAREKLWQTVIPADHPYHGAVIGSQADLDRASLADVRRFYDDYYAPSNATLVVAGDIELAESRTLVDKYFRSLPTWPKPSTRRVNPPVLNSEVRVDHVETVGSLAWVELMWLVPGRGQPGEIDLEVLALVLGDGISAKLQEALLIQTEQAESVEVSMQGFGSVGVFTIGAVVRPGVAPPDVIETIGGQLSFLQELPVEPAEVERAKKKIENEILFELEVGPSRAGVFQEHNHYEGDPGAYLKRLEALRAVTDTSVMAALKAWLPRDRRGVLVAKPSGPEEAAAAVTPTPPPAEETR